jgi:hypothetical protein
MSYNIDSIQIVESKDFYISLEDYKALEEKYAEDEYLPEVNIFDPGWVKGQTVKNGRIYPKHIWWSGNSGSEDLLKKILPAFNGSADLVLTWEGGDSFSGLRLKKGKVTKHNVKHVLV